VTFLYAVTFSNLTSKKIFNIKNDRNFVWKLRLETTGPQIFVKVFLFISTKTIEIEESTKTARPPFFRVTIIVYRYQMFPSISKKKSSISLYDIGYDNIDLNLNCHARILSRL
jgi:hypothetical protein